MMIVIGLAVVGGWVVGLVAGVASAMLFVPMSGWVIGLLTGRRS